MSVHNVLAHNTYEWCAPGIEPQIDTLQNVPMSAYPESYEFHKTGEVFYISGVSLLSRTGSVRLILERQGIQSLIVVPIMSEGSALGFIGIDSVRIRRSYSELEKQLLTLFAEMMSNVR